MEAGVCIVSEGLPREDSHSENVPLSFPQLVSHVPELKRHDHGSDAGHPQSPSPPASL